jgi:hypothetical protein
VRVPEASSISPSVRDALAVIHRQALEGERRRHAAAFLSSGSESAVF